MTIKFSELLSSQRLRPLWQRPTTELVAEPHAIAPAAQRILESPPELAGPHLVPETPGAVMAALEQSLRQELGASGLLLGHLLHPLRAAVARIDPRAVTPPSHPLQRATLLRLPELIDRLDDTLTGLLMLRGR